MEHFDVIVCGGGIAGVAAALAASRRGKKVLLAEKQAVLGGLATSGLIYIYLPISDELDRPVASGITEELLKRCQDYGPFTLHEKWSGIPGSDCGHPGTRYMCCFSPAGYELTLDKMLREADVEVRLESTVIGTRCDGSSRLTEVEIFCGADREKFSADCFIDATGGAYLLRLAGARVLPGSNYISPWFMEINDQSKSRYHLTENIHIQVVTDTSETGQFPEALTVADTQRFLKRQYEVIRSYYDALPEERRKVCYPLHLPGMNQLRTIARIAGKAEIQNGQAGMAVEDSVGIAADWRQLAPSWETPYGALVPEKIRGALAAGRCINTSGDAWQIYRVIPAAAMTGEAAGTAAALACSKGIDPADLNVRELQSELVKNGVILHISDVINASK